MRDYWFGGGIKTLFGMFILTFVLPMVLLVASVFSLLAALLVLAFIPVGVLLLVWGQASEHVANGDVRVRPSVKDGWFPRAVLSGFIASVAMLFMFGLAYGLALLLGRLVAGPQTTNSGMLVAAWFFNLAHNRITDLAQGSVLLAMGAHFTVGLMLAVLYALVAEQRLSGPDSLRGLVFSVLPWLLSLVVFFPLFGGGPFGVALGAGPLPFLGNLILHFVYGTILGTLYGPFGDTVPGIEEASREENQRAMRQAERASAVGIVGGLAIGLVAGISRELLLVPSFTIVSPPLWDVLGLALIGGAVGALVGSLFGLSSSGVATQRVPMN